MQYLLAWRMASAKNLLRRNEQSLTEVAERVSYGSASAFSVAFTRHVGLPPRGMLGTGWSRKGHSKLYFFWWSLMVALARFSLSPSTAAVANCFRIRG
jgi:AraC-like DNA-binding protein